MKEHTELTLSSMKKWDLVRYIIKLEKAINNIIKKLDDISVLEVLEEIKDVEI